MVPRREVSRLDFTLLGLQSGFGEPLETAVLKWLSYQLPGTRYHVPGSY